MKLEYKPKLLIEIIQVQSTTKRIIKANVQKMICSEMPILQIKSRRNKLSLRSLTPSLAF